MKVLDAARVMADRPDRFGAVLDRAARLTSSSLSPIARRSKPVPELGRRPLVSVIIPCFNYGSFLSASIPSALSQTGVDVEVIVVNDASTDDSAEVAAAFAARDSRVTVVSHTTNTGHVVAFNDGYALATGEFIVRLDADDLLTDGSLARAIALFDTFPSVGLVYGHPRHFTTSHLPEARTSPSGWTVWSGASWIMDRCVRTVNCITTPEAMVRADVMKKVGPLDTRLRYAQDMEMWLRVAAVSDVGHIDGADQALHRDHAASMSATEGSAALTDLTERRTVFDVLFGGPGRDLVDATVMHETARRGLAAEALVRAAHSLVRAHTAEYSVEQFIDFARSTYPAYTTLPEWRALQRRQRVGPRAARFVPTFLLSVLRYRVADELAYVRWTRTGT